MPVWDDNGGIDIMMSLDRGGPEVYCGLLAEGRIMGRHEWGTPCRINPEFRFEGWGQLKHEWSLASCPKVIGGIYFMMD